MKTKQKIKSFLVDDDKIFISNIKHLLSNTNIQPDNIMTFQSGEECIYNLRKYKPEIIFLDYNLSVSSFSTIDGADLIKRIKRFTPDSEIIILTSKENIEIAVHTLDNRASRYIIKDEIGLNKIKYLLININNDLEFNGSKTKKHYERIEFLTFIFTILLFYFFNNLF